MGKFEKGNTIGHRFQKGNKDAKNQGRKPKIINLLQGVPEDAQKQVYNTLFNAIRLQDVAQAKAYLSAKGDELGEYGFILQLAIKSLMGKDGWHTFTDICNRLFGTPKRVQDLNVNGATSIQVIVPSEDDKGNIDKL